MKLLEDNAGMLSSPRENLERQLHRANGGPSGGMARLLLQYAWTPQQGPASMIHLQDVYVRPFLDLKEHLILQHSQTN